jgi:hypothetical protein
MQSIIEEHQSVGIIWDCGKESRFPVYVYAHWDIEVIFTCSRCAKRVIICAGEIIREL